MKKALFKETLRSINRSMARFISIIAIVALGISFFAGTKATAPDMKETAELYFKDANLMDARVISPVGLTDDDIKALEDIEGVDTVMPSRFVDGILKVDGKSIGDIDGSEMTCRAISLDFDAAIDYSQNDQASSDYMNRVTLVDGQWPSKPGECVVDGSALSAPEEFKIGQTISLAGDGTNIENKLKVTEFKITGIIMTPTYISFERGNTNIGSGKLGTFIYVSDDVFNFDYYTEAYLTVAGADSYSPYTEEYTNFVAPILDKIEDVASQRLPVRIEEVRAEYEPKVTDGEAELAEKQAEYDEKVENGAKEVQELKDKAANGQAEIDAMKEQFNASLSDAQRELYDSSNEHAQQYALWRQKQDEFNQTKIELSKYANADKELSSAKSELDSAKIQIDTSQNTVTEMQELVSTTRTSLEYFKSHQNESKEELREWIEQSGLPPEQVEDMLNTLNSFTAIGTAEEMIAYLEPVLEDYENQLAEDQKKLDEAKEEYNQKYAEYQEAYAEYQKYLDAQSDLTAAEVELKEAERQLNSAGVDIQLGELELSMSQKQLQSQIQLAETQLAAAQSAAETADETFEQEKAAAAEELSKAKMDLNEAKDLLASLDTAEWMIQDRDDQPGYTGYGQTADRMAAFAQVFPIFFFLVAALVCLTTMTRMVEEERTQLGTLKALGYSSGAIASKYLIYSITASLIGSVIGLLLGFYIFPKAIFAAYGIMYELPPCVIRFKWSYAIIGTIISLFATTAASFIACRKELKENPARLMRPKAPKKGKRILLEKVGFIWSRLNFTSKVTARNLFRNKKRFITTLIGVAGCTALLLTGFGLGDSITAIMDNQFGDNGICNYDVQIVLSERHSLAQGRPEVMNEIEDRAEIKKSMMTQMEVIDGTSDRTDDVLEINLLVPENAAALSEFVKLNNRQTGESVTLGDNGVIITEKFANQTKTEVGDNITIITSDGKEVSVPVSGIVENYTFHYVYMSPAFYQQTFGTEPEFNYVTAILSDNVNAAQKETLATELMKVNGIDAVAYTTQTIDTFDQIINSLNLVVAIFIIAAGALSFVVLYNLSNINLNERVREVATIKVLGFRDNEVSTYIVRENIILTIIGTALGLILGVFLHSYVVTVAEVDVVMFGRSIEPLSFVYAAVLSLVFAAIVNLIMHFKLKKVNMVESLKAVE